MAEAVSMALTFKEYDGAQDPLLDILLLRLEEKEDKKKGSGKLKFYFLKLNLEFKVVNT